MVYRLSVIALILKISGTPIVVRILSIRVHLRQLTRMTRRGRRLRVIIEGVRITVKGIGIEGIILGEIKILKYLCPLVLHSISPTIPIMIDRRRARPSQILCAAPLLSRRYWNLINFTACARKRNTIRRNHTAHCAITNWLIL